MDKGRFCCTVAIAAWLATAAWADVNKLDSRANFTQESVAFDFEGLITGADASRLLSEWGILFEGQNSTPRVDSSVVVFFVTSFLANQPHGADSSNSALIVNFRFPVKRVGFRAKGGAADEVTVKAFDAFGKSLGEVKQAGLDTEPFVGVEAMAGEEISKIVVDYGASPNPEQLDDLIVEFVQRPRFQTYLAQVADGPLPGGALRTLVVVTNVSNSTAQGELRVFSNAGAPLTFDFDGNQASVFPFAIPPRSSRAFQSSGTTNPVKAGYICVEANVPIEATAIFQIVDGTGKPVSEAGVGSDQGRSISVGGALRVELHKLDTGVAVVNIGSQRADGRVELYDQDGNLVAVNDNDLNLEAGAKVARFLSELFPQLASSDFSGSLVILSDQPLVVVLIRTIGGRVSSSLPVGSTQR